LEPVIFVTSVIAAEVLRRYVNMGGRRNLENRKAKEHLEIIFVGGRIMLKAIINTLTVN
jgi:hypothetical protein